jgi:DNA-binding NarL/FixJ family response regulator
MEGQMEKHILIGDDSAIVRNTLRTFLEQEDSWVVVGEAENGKEAVEKAQELKPDLVVLDLAMPVMNGIEAASVLKRLSPSLPVVIFTDYAGGPHLAEIALLAGVNAVVPKTEPRTLVKRIYDLLEPAA